MAEELMLVSILLPTRGRVELLKRSVGSLRELAKSPGLIELCIATDADDEASTDAAYELGADVVYTAPIRVGYGNLHHYVNALATKASGTWLWLWNDDAMVRTLAWDRVLVQLMDNGYAPGVLNPYTNHPGQGDMAIFPIVHRSIVDKLGHFSQSAHCDTYVEHLGKGLRRFWNVPIHVFHDRPDLTGRPEDATHRERIYQTERFYSPEVQGLIRADLAELEGTL